MIFSETPFDGAFIIELEKHQDQRGYFARTFCQREFEAKLSPPTARRWLRLWAWMAARPALYHQSARFPQNARRTR